MSIIHDLQTNRCCLHRSGKREERLRARLKASVTPAARRLLLAYTDEQDARCERSAFDSYQAGLCDGISLMTSLYKKD